MKKLIISLLIAAFMVMALTACPPGFYGRHGGGHYHHGGHR
jgi:hypothetical protein